MDDKFLTELDETTTDLLNTISLFTDEQFNKIPFEGSWTPAQVCEHLLKANSGAVQTLNGSTGPTERNYRENEKTIKDIFLDFTTKFKSPDFILPSNDEQNKEVILRKFASVMEKIKNTALNEDLTLTCTEFELPGIGKMTRYEWICFVSCHSRRHTHQLKNIHQKISA